MSFTIVRPEYLDEFVDITKPEEGDRFRIIMNPHTVDYVILLNRPDAVKRIMEIKEPIKFLAVEVKDEQSKVFEDNANGMIAQFPIMKYFATIRYVFMNTLQRKDLTLDRRLLILNYATSNIQGMADQFKQDMIPDFCNKIAAAKDVTEILKFFDKMPVNLPFALANGIMVLKTLTGMKDFKRLMTRAYGGLGISGPEALSAVDLGRYVDMRKEFARIYQDERPHIFENIMINYLWDFVTPFTIPAYSMWDNFVFYIMIFNALKILITLTAPKDDDDFAEIVSTFSRALSEVNQTNGFVDGIIKAAKNIGADSNGDLGVLTIS
ncbi:MAG: hypothetical protein LBL87_07775 [Ruminococcus sp.]|jgi:hypothetical protein|nr:hypothetical protein [Ruminococcus sp.]